MHNPRLISDAVRAYMRAHPDRAVEIRQLASAYAARQAERRAAKLEREVEKLWREEESLKKAKKERVDSAVDVSSVEEGTERWQCR